jgi:hypothetical protein
VSSFRFIGALWLLAIYIYSVAGTILFGANDPRNFGTLHKVRCVLLDRSNAPPAIQPVQQSTS